jgi:hypothetical protein
MFSYKKKMSAALCSSLTIVPDLSPDDYTMGEPANKKAKIEIASFSQLNLQEFALKQVGKSKKDQKFYANIAGLPIRANLTPADWLSTRFGFDFSGAYEKPSFLGGKAPERSGCPESLSIRVSLSAAQAEFLQKLDEASQSAFSDITPCKWNPLISAQYNQCKFNAVLAGDGMTKLAVVNDGKVLRGEGFDFLQTFKTNFAQSDVKLVFRVRKVWHQAGKAGLSLEATQLVLRPSERPVEEEAFANDDDLLAE